MPRREINLKNIRIRQPAPVAAPSVRDDAPKLDCAVTFRNDGDLDIIVEPRNDYGDFDKATLIPSGRSVMTYLYPASYVIWVYSVGYEKEFFPSFQRWGERATSANITIGFNEDSKRFSWKVNSILRGTAPLFPPEEMDKNNVTRDDEDDVPPVQPEETEYSGDDSDVDRNPQSNLGYKSLDIVFVVDATVGHGNFLASTVSAIRSALREDAIAQAFRTRAFRAALVVTRDYTDGGSGLERIGFTSSLKRFEMDLDSIEVAGGDTGFCAFNTGMGEAMGPDIGWRSQARRLVIVATAGIPHGIGEKMEEDKVESYIVSLTDPIRMARRMGLLGVDLVFLTDADLINSDDSRILCFFRALSRMISGAGVYQTGDPSAIYNYIAPCMPTGWSFGARAHELRVSDAVQRSSAFQNLDRIYSQANTLTSSGVLRDLRIDTPYAVPMAGRMMTAAVTFINNGRTKIGVQCRDGNRRVVLNKNLGKGASGVASVQANTRFSYVLQTPRRKKELTDRTSGRKTIDVSRKI